MDISTIGIRRAPREQESLAVCLRAVGEAARLRMDYDDLCAALGVSFAGVFVPDEPSPALWGTYGRDVFVERVADRFGLRLRNLHPPTVAVDMLRAEEFPQHFEWSYKPLIARALENGQPVLAWRGWEGEASAHWGIVNRQEGDSFAGPVGCGDGTARRLVAPALQCYVVEEWRAEVPEPMALLRLALEHGLRFLENRAVRPADTSFAAPQIVTGPAAWAAAIDQFSSEGVDASGPKNLSGLSAWLKGIITERGSLAAFLHRYRTQLADEPGLMLEEAVGAIQALTEALHDWPDRLAVELSDTARGLKALIEPLRRAEAAEARLAGAVNRLLHAVQGAVAAR